MSQCTQNGLVDYYTHSVEAVSTSQGKFNKSGDEYNLVGCMNDGHQKLVPQEGSGSFHPYDGT